jgi:TP901 family phage tail tape measure protein
VAVSNVELRVNATQAVTALKNVDGQAKKFNTTITGTGGKLKATSGSLKLLPAGLQATGAGAVAAGGGFRALTAAAAPLLGPLIGISAVIGGLTKVFGNLAQQDFASAKIKTLGVDADALNPKLKSLSNELSGQASSLDLLSASYDVASAGFGETAELTDVLKASQLGATGGFSELATVADATTSVLNAYGLSSDQAAKLVDGFIQTQNDGKIVVDQYAQQIGRLAPIAAGAGVGIDELNAAISTVTATGVPVESTFAGLRQVIAAIQKPTSEAAKAAEKLGIDFSATALSTKGLGGVLEELVAKGGASEETLAQFFGSVEARTALLPLVNDQLVSFNKNLENQAKAQGTAAEAAFTAQNTIQGQLTRLGSAFTNLTTEGSELGIIIRESLKIAAVTVEALGAAFKLVMAPVRALFAAVGEVGKQIGKAIGIDATKTLVNLEQGWIGIKERVTEVSDQVVFAGKVIGGVYANIYKKIFGLLKDLAKGTKDIFIGIIDTFKGVVQGIVDAINGNPILKRLFGGLTNIKLDFDIKGIKNFGKDFLKGANEKVTELKNNVIEFSGVERQITEENNKQIDAKNKIVETNGQIKKDLDEIKKKEQEAKEEAKKLEETFFKIGESVRNDLVGNLREAIKGSQSFGQAIGKVLGNLKDKLIDLALNKAISGIGNSLSGGKGFGGFLGGLFGGKKERGGRVNAGGAFLVGERGPEILQMGSKGGNIIPNSQLGKGGGGTTNVVTVNVDANSSNVSGNNADANQLGNQIAIAIQSELIKQKRAGGLLA